MSISCCLIPIRCAAKLSSNNKRITAKQNLQAPILKTSTDPQFFIPSPLDNRRLAHLCGPLDENLRQISAALDVTLFRRGEKFIASGDNALRATEILEQFYALADKPISVEDIQLALVELRAGAEPDEVFAEAPAIGVKDASEFEFPVLKTR